MSTQLLCAMREESVLVEDQYNVQTLVFEPTDGYSQTIVWLHGIGGGPAQYVSMLTRLSSQWGVRILAPWLPCHGTSTDVESHAEMIARLIGWANHFNVNKALWMGHSMGGVLAVSLAGSAPHLVSHVAPIASPVGSQFTKRPTGLALALRIVILAADSFEAVSRANWHAFWHGDTHHFLKAVTDAMHPSRLDRALRVLMTAPDMVAAIRSVNASGITVTCFWGNWDAVVRPSREELDARSVVLRGSHCWPLKTWGSSHEQVSDYLGQTLGLARTEAPEPAPTTTLRLVTA